MRKLASVYGLSVKDLPDGWVALDAVVLVKGIDGSGQVRYAEISTGTLSPMEGLGMATTFGDTCRSLLLRGTIGFGDK